MATNKYDEDRIITIDKDGNATVSISCDAYLVAKEYLTKNAKKGGSASKMKLDSLKIKEAVEFLWEYGWNKDGYSISILATTYLDWRKEQREKLKKRVGIEAWRVERRYREFSKRTLRTHLQIALDNQDVLKNNYPKALFGNKEFDE